MYPKPSQAHDQRGVNKLGQGCLMLICGCREGKPIFPALPHPSSPDLNNERGSPRAEERAPFCQTGLVLANATSPRFLSWCSSFSAHHNGDVGTNSWLMSQESGPWMN